MNVYLFLFATCEVAAYQFESRNVGTVLFSPSDKSKKRWSTPEIGLLRARRHFQKLIPPPDMINTNEDFINALLGYFKGCYTSIKSEAKDPKSDSIMNAALSDALGGYLKAWVLPVTKFAYYGGTVSREDAVKLFQLYDEIKQSLSTNGSAWRSPNNNMLNSVSINVASLHSPTTRKVENPCDTLAYFEMSDNCLLIPVPKVNWDSNSASIFVPLKNQTLIPLESSNNESLVKYYNAATRCIEASKLEDQNQFEARFQKWLTKEVIPHLNDEQFYPALGSVLSLVNRTRNLVDTVIDLYAEAPPTANNKLFFGIPVDLSSKKMKIFAIIVILEVAWCIPTLCFLMCRKMRRNKKNNVFVYVEKDSGKNYKRNQNNIISRSESPQLTPKQSCFNETETSNKDITAKHRREVHTQSTTRTQGIDLRCHRLSKSCNIKARHSIIATKPCPGAGTNYNISQMCSYIDKTVYERPIHPRHSSYTKCSANAVDTHKSSTSQEGNSGVPYKNSLRIANSLTMTPEQTKTVTLLKERHKTNEIIEIEKHDAESQKTTETNSVATDATKTACRCSHSRDCTKKIRYIVKSVKNTPAPVPVTQPAPKTALLKPPNVVGDTKSRGVRLSTGDPYLEITIDKPQRKVSVDYSQIQAQPIIPKRSKIPKRAVRSKEAQTVKVATKNRSISFPKRQSYIPQPKRQKTEDDIIIKNKKTSTGRDAFNITM